MNRRPLNFLTALSLLLSVALLVLWAWSYDAWRVGIGRGSVRVVFVGAGGGDGEEFIQTTQDRTAALMWELLRREASYSLAFAGFEFHRGDSGGRFPFTLLAVPFWALLPLTVALPAARAWSSRRERRRLAAGLCRACGYNLRDSPDRCPECGAPAPVKPG